MKNLDKDLTLGSRAKELLENPVLQEAFSEIEQEIFAKWQASKPNEPEKREEAYRLNLALSLLQNRIQTIANNGKLAETEMQRLEQKASPTI